MGRAARRDAPTAGDGANVAHAHSADGASFSARGVALALGWFAARGFAHVVAFLPAHHLLERSAGAAADARGGGGGARMQTEEWAMLDDLRRRGFVAATPSNEDDDAYIVTFAARVRGDAVIVSNDHYRQHPRGTGGQPWPCSPACEPHTHAIDASQDHGGLRRDARRDRHGRRAA